MSLKWLAERLGRGAKRRKQVSREKAWRNCLNRQVKFETLESRTLLSASLGSLHSVAAAAGKLTAPAVFSTHTSGATGPAAPTSGQTGGSTSGATPPTLSTAAAATLCVHILPPAPLGPQGPGGPGGAPGGPGGSTTSGSGQSSSSSTPSTTPSVITGTTVTVVVQALDANGVPTSNYSGTASVTCSDSSVTVPATLTFKNGIATFQATVGAIGTDTFTVTDTTTATITGTATVNIVAAPKATQYGVNILPPPPNGSGSGSTGSKTGSTSGTTTGTGTGQLPPPPPGQGGTSSNGGSGGGGASQLPPPPPPPPPQSGATPSVTAGSTVTVQVVALDANGHPVPNYTGTATIASSDTSVTVPSGITFKNGVATFQVTLSTVESETLTVTSSGGTIDGSVTVNVVAATTSGTSTSSSQTKSAAAVASSTSKTSSQASTVKPAATVKPARLRS